MKQSKILPYLVAAICSGGALNSMAEESANSATLDEVTVTGTREGRALAETPASIGIVKGEAIRSTSPKHPTEIMGQVPGVWVNITGGEGHQTAIRQPLTTSPVYLYLEDGIPTRSTGFFNHNALYEINLPMAGGIEVTKGPGSALYGSDSIGGVVNVLTRPAPLKPEAQLTAEGGENGWGRVMMTGGNTVGDNGYRADLNLTHTDGWRDATGYDRQSGTLRWDKTLGSNAVLKTVASFSNIDQETAGSSTISRDDYLNNPTRNYTPISFRKVQAFRLSAAYEKETADSLLSVTPYYRNNDMDLLANWSLSYDPTVYNTSNQSFGMMVKYRKDFVPYRSRMIVGVDVDHSPGSRLEKSIGTTATGTGYTRIYTAYTTGATVYDYDATYRGIAPYIHGEMSPTDKLRLTGGLRYDDIRYDYDNRLTDSWILAGGRYYGHAADTSLSYNHLSPKLGATYAFSQNLNGFAAYNHAFRAPSEGQLFRPSAGAGTTDAQRQASAQANAASALGLKPVKVDSYEIGLRGKLGRGIGWEASVYHMTKSDDILSYRDPVTNASQSLNAGKTLHRGIELGLGADLTKEIRLDVAYSYAKHTYEKWAVNPTTDYSGNEMSTAPRSIANTRLSYAPAALNGGKVALEWVSLGSYWMDDANSAKYEGHDIYNLRINYRAGKDVELFGSVTNLTDKRYAESASLSSGNPVYAPALPRTFYAGLRFNWM
ncbi:MAG: TonB-dependent receptor [Sulfurimicrobium sp.]|nr:TonB-dependent receptor [Sulfurimicrobium sp.]